MPPKLSLQKLFDTPRFHDCCEQWSTRDHSMEGVYSDVYDGKIWQDFQTLNRVPFLSEPYTYGLMMKKQMNNIEMMLILFWSQRTKQREKQESSLGCRYSVLLDLPYFDPVRMCIIDPMHNLYLGSAKRILKWVWF